VEAVSDYPGALLVPPRDVPALRGALLGLPALRGKRYADPHSWESVADKFTALFDQVRGNAVPGDGVARPVPAQPGLTAKAVTGKTVTGASAS
jgi:hypothetical protein